MLIPWSSPEQNNGQPQALLTWLAILALAFVAYYVALAMQHRRGVPVEFAFSALPPE
jgi:hypothetical protein